MKALTKYFKNREIAINSLLQKTTGEYTPDTFHELRLEIKKLNAFLELIHFCSKNFKRKKTFRPFKLIFRQAGKVRELQVEEEMLKKYFQNNLLKNYRSGLKKLRLNEQEKFFLVADKKFVTHLKKKYPEVVPFLKNIDKKKVSAYMEKKKKQIEELLDQKTLKTLQLHLLRKQLKTFQYNRKSMSTKMQNMLILKREISPELLGKWHDCEVITGHLKKAMISGESDPKEIKQFEKIKAIFSSESKLLLNKINESNK